MAKDKKESQEEQDLLTRNAEMAEDKSPEEAAAIYRKGDKYYCAECHSELPMHTDCPGCHAHIDWGRAMAEGRFI